MPLHSVFVTCAVGCVRERKGEAKLCIILGSERNAPRCMHTCQVRAAIPVRSRDYMHVGEVLHRGHCLVRAATGVWP